MSIFKKLFSTKTNQQANSRSDFSEGDIFYTYFENKYHIYKLLVYDKDSECYHVLGYKPLDTLPNNNNFDDLEVAVYHVPIDKNGFPNCIAWEIAVCPPLIINKFER